MKSKKFVIVLLLTAAIYVSVRVYHLGYFALWHDEVFSVTVASMSWHDMFRAIVADIVHPPLFYILLKCWISIGGISVVWMRTLALLISIATLPPLLLFCREWCLSNGETLIAFLLVTFNEILIHYSQELRMYSLLVGLSVLSLWLFSRWLHVGRGLLWLTGVNLLLAYTHYYGALFVFTEALFAVWWGWKQHNRNGVIRFSSSAIVVGLLFAPWLYLVATVARTRGLSQNLRYFVPPTIRDVIWFYAGLKGQIPVRHTAMLGLIVFLLAVAGALFAKSQPRGLTQELLLFGFFPTIVSVAVSYLTPQAIFNPRYLITVAVPCLILIAIGIMALKPLPRRTLALLVLTWSIGSGAWFTLRTDRKVPWDRLATDLLSQPAPIYTYEPHEHAPLDFYGAANTMLPSQADIVKIPQQEFYVVYRPTTWQGPTPDVVLRSRGLSAVDRIEVHDIYENILALRFKPGFIAQHEPTLRKDLNRQ